MLQRCFRVDDLKIVGDPHLGKTFINGVPLGRRGERERMQRESFLQALDPQGAKVHVLMGDLFDKPVVPLETIMFAAKAYTGAIRQHPETPFLALAGNHDLSRDTTHISAFQIFAEMVPGIRAVMQPQCFQGFLFVPWSPFKSASEVIEGLEVAPCTTAFGHWDLDGSGSNLIPIAALKRIGIRKVFNGHVHLPRLEERDGIEIINVGSLQPFAHGEGNELYLTVTLDEAKVLDLKEKCVRVRLNEGEILDFELDCLQLQVEAPRHNVDLSVDYDGTFDLKKLAERARKEAGVPDEIWAKVLEKM
jgi:DNA repair exonuclease SbcCD nuclease subunit